VRGNCIATLPRRLDSDITHRLQVERRFPQQAIRFDEFFNERHGREALDVTGKKAFNTDAMGDAKAK